MSMSASGGALTGWRVLVPRPVDHAAALVSLLSDAGAEVVAVELISIAAPADLADFDLQLGQLSRAEYGWVAFTSANAVSAVLDRSSMLGFTPPIGTTTKVAAVGPATAAALHAAGQSVDLQPPTGGSAAALAEVWPPAVAGDSVLLPRSDLAPSQLPDHLSNKGYRVQTVIAYQTVVQPPAPSLAAELSAGRFDAVLFTSASTVTALAGVSLPAATALGAIGQPTSRALLAAGRTVAFTAPRPSAAGLVDGLLDFAAMHRQDKKAEVSQ
jgi:uroporphyrinogen-III synthase